MVTRVEDRDGAQEEEAKRRGSPAFAIVQRRLTHTQAWNGIFMSTRVINMQEKEINQLVNLSVCIKEKEKGRQTYTAPLCITHRKKYMQHST